MLLLRFAQVVEAEVLEDAVQDQAVQFIQARPAQFARAHTLHGRLVAGTPGQRKCTTVHRRAQGLHFARNAAVPIHHGAKDIEGQYLRRGQGAHGMTLTLLPKATRSRTMAASGFGSG